jgi:hypothetical protein
MIAVLNIDRERRHAHDNRGHAAFLGKTFCLGNHIQSDIGPDAHRQIRL